MEGIIDAKMTSPAAAAPVAAEVDDMERCINQNEIEINDQSFRNANLLAADEVFG